MKALAKSVQVLINKLLGLVGLELIRKYPNERGLSIYADVKFYLRKTTVVQCVDVGANIGQTTQLLANLYPESKILSIEPDESTHETLKNNCDGNSNIKTLCAFVGARKGTTPFYVNKHSDMSSALKPGNSGWGSIAGEIMLEMRNLEEIAHAHGIAHINFLKVDTQGFDFEVLKGAKGMLKSQAIDLVAIEHIFSDLYEQTVPLDEVLAYMRSCDYELLAFYHPIYQKNRMGWADLLFASKAFLQKH